MELTQANALVDELRGKEVICMPPGTAESIAHYLGHIKPQGPITTLERGTFYLKDPAYVEMTHYLSLLLLINNREVDPINRGRIQKVIDSIAGMIWSIDEGFLEREILSDGKLFEGIKNCRCCYSLAGRIETHYPDDKGRELIGTQPLLIIPGCKDATCEWEERHAKKMPSMNPLYDY